MRVYHLCLLPDEQLFIFFFTGEHESLGRLVKRINTSYVYYFNQKWDRVGICFMTGIKVNL